MLSLVHGLSRFGHRVAVFAIIVLEHIILLWLHDGRGRIVEVDARLHILKLFHFPLGLPILCLFLNLSHLLLPIVLLLSNSDLVLFKKVLLLYNGFEVPVHNQIHLTRVLMVVLASHCA